MLEAHVVKRRRQFVVDASLAIARGESAALFGPSGAGKSTFLSCVAGLERPDSGTIVWEARVLFPAAAAVPARPFGYLAHDPALFPHMTVARNVAFGVAGVADRPQLLAQLRDAFRLADLWSARPAELSAGQARRVALARMLARRPAVVLLDEPFSGLDRVVVRELIALLRRWQAEHAFAMLVVDHQEHVLRALCSVVYVMEQGRIVQAGSWDQIDRAPATATLSALLSPL